VVFGLIQCAHVADAVLDAAGKIDAAKLDNVGRMGGNDYCYTRERFELERG
jgi:flavin reductase (DIM6/NTAB) family NADH-FMN oxidoreductase RutF